MKKTVQVLLTLLMMVIHLSVVNAASLDDSLVIATANIRLTHNSVGMLSDGSYVLAGEEADYYPTDVERAALIMCIDATGKEVWRYEENYLPNTKNSFYDTLVLDDDSIIVLHSVTRGDYSMQSFAVHLKDGKVKNRIEFEDNVSQLYAIGESIFAFSTHKTITGAGGAPIHYPRCVMYDLDGNTVWETNYDLSFKSSRVLYYQEALYFCGMTTTTNGASFYPFLAKLDMNGDLLWDMTYTQAKDARYLDMSITENGVIIAVGGIYESGDGTEPARAIISGYDTNGQVTWILEYDLSGLLLESVVTNGMGEHFASGTNHVDPFECMLVRFDGQGEFYEQRNEHLSKELDSPEHVFLLAKGEDVFLVASAKPLNTEDNSESNTTGFKTIIKRISSK